MNKPKTEVPEMMRDCQRKGGYTYNTRMVIVRVETQRILKDLHDQSALFRFVVWVSSWFGLLTNPRRKR